MQSKDSMLRFSQKWATLSIDLEERKKKIGVGKRSFCVWYQENGKLPSDSFHSPYKIGIKVISQDKKSRMRWSKERKDNQRFLDW